MFNVFFSYENNQKIVTLVDWWIGETFAIGNAVINTETERTR
jgi:hypothetical protein